MNTLAAAGRSPGDRLRIALDDHRRHGAAIRALVRRTDLDPLTMPVVRRALVAASDPGFAELVAVLAPVLSTERLAPAVDSPDIELARRYDVARRAFYRAASLTAAGTAPSNPKSP